MVHRPAVGVQLDLLKGVPGSISGSISGTSGTSIPVPVPTNGSSVSVSELRWGVHLMTGEMAPLTSSLHRGYGGGIEKLLLELICCRRIHTMREVSVCWWIVTVLCRDMCAYIVPTNMLVNMRILHLSIYPTYLHAHHYRSTSSFGAHSCLPNTSTTRCVAGRTALSASYCSTSSWSLIPLIPPIPLVLWDWVGQKTLETLD